MDTAQKREKREDRLFEKLRIAMQNNDPQAYAKVAGDLGYDDGTERHRELIERAAADRMFERMKIKDTERPETETVPAESEERSRKSERRTRNEFNPEIFEREVALYRARNGSVELSPYEHTETKRRILRASGLDYLMVSKGYSVPIMDAKPERVGRVFLGRYNALIRKK